MLDDLPSTVFLFLSGFLPALKLLDILTLLHFHRTVYFQASQGQRVFLNESLQHQLLFSFLSDLFPTLLSLSLCLLICLFQFDRDLNKLHHHCTELDTHIKDKHIEKQTENLVTDLYMSLQPGIYRYMRGSLEILCVVGL